MRLCIFIVYVGLKLLDFSERLLTVPGYLNTVLSQGKSPLVKEFIKNRIVTGLVVLVPIIVIGIILSDYIKKLMHLTNPITKKFSFGGPFLESTVAIILIILIFFVIQINAQESNFKYWHKDSVLSWTDFWGQTDPYSSHRASVNCNIEYYFDIIYDTIVFRVVDGESPVEIMSNGDTIEYISSTVRSLSEEHNKEETNEEESEEE